MKTYKEFIITADPFNVDILSSLLWELDITGINEEENCLKVFTDPENPVTIDEIILQLKKLQSENLITNFNISESIVEEKNWNEEWEKSLNVIHITDRIVIKPSFKPYEKQKNEIVITIDPKMSFGTGEHATTKLIVRLLEKNIISGMKILDVGTGTGILAILSICLGASAVVGFDNDEWCYENAVENSELNNVADKVQIIFGEINNIADSDFDMILANIQKNILLDLADEFKKRLKTGWVLLLSGLLNEDEEGIRNNYSGSGFRFIESIHLDEWLASSFQRT